MQKSFSYFIFSQTGNTNNLEWDQIEGIDLSTNFQALQHAEFSSCYFYRNANADQGIFAMVWMTAFKPLWWSWSRFGSLPAHSKIYKKQEQQLTTGLVIAWFRHNLPDSLSINGLVDLKLSFCLYCAIWTSYRFSWL